MTGGRLPCPKASPVRDDAAMRHRGRADHLKLARKFPPPSKDPA